MLTSNTARGLVISAVLTLAALAILDSPRAGIQEHRRFEVHCKLSSLAALQLGRRSCWRSGSRKPDEENYDLNLTRVVSCLIAVALAFFASPVASAKKHKAAPTQPTDSNYIAALATANRFLATWRDNDQAAAMPWITNRAKQQSTEEGVDKLFSGSSTRAFEISRGRLVRQGRYQFSIVLLQNDDSGHTRRRFTQLIITNTGNNDWAWINCPRYN